MTHPSDSVAAGIAQDVLRKLFDDAYNNAGIQGVTDTATECFLATCVALSVVVRDDKRQEIVETTQKALATFFESCWKTLDETADATDGRR